MYNNLQHYIKIFLKLINFKFISSTFFPNQKEFFQFAYIYLVVSVSWSCCYFATFGMLMLYIPFWCVFLISCN